MPEPELGLLFVRPLNRLGIRYLVSGSVAAIVYGEPRLTHDVDLVVFLGGDQVPRLEEVFRPPEFYLPPREVIYGELARERGGHFNVIHAGTGFKADFYPAGEDDFHAWAFRGRRQLEYRGERLVVAPPEYVIVRKLEYFREGGSEKHLRDIRGILNVSADQLDRVALEEWVRRLGVTAQWQDALQPPRP
jgi:hypothetical protein